MRGAALDESRHVYYNCNTMTKRKGRTITMRLEESLAARVANVARLRGSSVSDVVRDSLNETLDHQERLYTMTVYERLKPWIGIYDSSKHPGAPFTSDDASKQARATAVKKWERRNARRPR